MREIQPVETPQRGGNPGGMEHWQGHWQGHEGWRKTVQGGMDGYLALDTGCPGNRKGCSPSSPSPWVAGMALGLASSKDSDSGV